MPYSTEWKPHGVIWRYSGRLTGDELIQSNVDIYGDERFDDLTYQIVDLSEVTDVAVEEHHMRKIAHLDMAAARTNPRIRVAVVEGCDTEERLTALYTANTCATHWPTASFLTWGEAVAWLGGKVGIPAIDALESAK